MSYKIDSIPLFDKQAKRLAKKYPSLKNDLAGLLKVLLACPNREQHLAMAFIKSGYLLPPKAGANLVAQGSSLT